MKKALKLIRIILTCIGIIMLGLTVILLTVRLIGKLYNRRTPEGGINETM